MRYDERPIDPTLRSTGDLPPTPLRDRTVPATAWIEAPEQLLRLGDDLPGAPVAEYKRRIGPWILWRSGPAKAADARYWVCHRDDHSLQFTLRLFADGSASGVGPDGRTYDRFRAWKESLRDSVEVR
jgi:hypothetical protein